MPYQTGLPAALAARGLTVEVVPGWETRGSPSFSPWGSVSHWTAGPRTGDRPSLRICTDGRPDLPGPLCNVFLTRAGVAVVVAAGRANHAGKGGWRGMVGNSSVFGTEAESSGGNDWTDAQRWAYPRINAAYCDLAGFDPDQCCDHWEWAVPKGRKTDITPGGWRMEDMRSAIRAVIDEEDDDMPLTDEDVRRIASAVHDQQVGASGLTIGQALDRARQATPSVIATAVWKDTKVRRTSGDVTALQELADAKTLTLAQAGQVSALTEALRTLAQGQGVDLAAVAAAAEAGVERALDGARVVVTKNEEQA